MLEYFREVCTRNAVLSPDDQIKLYDFIQQRINAPKTTQSDDFPALNTKIKSRVQQKQPTPKKVYAVMDETNEIMFFYRVLTQSILASGDISDFTRRAYYEATFFCLKHGDMKQSYVGLTKLVYDIYPHLIKTNTDLQEEYMTIVGIYALYIILHSASSDQGLVALFKSFPNVLKYESIKYALNVHSAITHGNYSSYFSLYRASVDVKRQLLESHVENMRQVAIKHMKSAYYSLPLSFVASTLCFESNELARLYINTANIEIAEDTVVFKRIPNKPIIK